MNTSRQFMIFVFQIAPLSLILLRLIPALSNNESTKVLSVWMEKRADMRGHCATSFPGATTSRMMERLCGREPSSRLWEGFTAERRSISPCSPCPSECWRCDRTTAFQTQPASSVMHHCLGQFDLKISFFPPPSSLK